MPTKTTITNRKRSAEICPHPPHLLNKRYWEDKTGKSRIKSSNQNISTKTEIPVVNPIDKTLIQTTLFNKNNFEIPPFSSPLSNRKKPNSLDINSVILNSPENYQKTINYDQNNISYPTNIIPPFLSSFPLRFSSNELQSTSNFDELIKTIPSSQFNLQMFTQQPSFNFPPVPQHFNYGFFPEQIPMFQQGTSTGIIPSINSNFPNFQQFPQFLNEKQNIEKCTKLKQLIEIFNKNETIRESTNCKQQNYQSEIGSNKGKKIKSCISDDQIDKIMDEMVQNQDKKSKKKNSHNEPFCILPLPVPIPIIVPLSSDFILKYFASK